MTSMRKVESNRRNASLSSGPRTQGGKLRSRRNALRHGLASPIGNDLDERANVERLALVLSGYTNDWRRLEEARISAECHFDLQRIRNARFEVFRALGDVQTATSDQLALATRAIEKIARYERRALSKRRTALRAIGLKERAP